ncbi:long-chain fatty acid--CoA ligase (plasmid) [Azospirillum sp. 412522]|nr:AMP-binding protein [Azospirillum sp. 412522]MBY6266526.1 long-chain fatty acid--CoA ligase [Azospirillum sp. 412522]
MFPTSSRQTDPPGSLIDGDGGDCGGGAGRRWSGAALEAELDRLAALMKEPAGRDLVMLFCGSSADDALLLLAALRAGHAAAPFDHDLPAGRRRDLVAAYRPLWLFQRAQEGEEPPPGYAAHPMPMPMPVGGLRGWRRLGGAEPTIHPDLAVLLSTSGTLGSPRTARLSRRGLAANARSAAAALRIAPGDVAAGHLRLSYAFGLSILLSHLAAGAAVAMTGQGMMGRGLWDMLRREGCTTLPCVPAQAAMLCRLDPGRLKLPALRRIVQAGGRAAPDHLARLHGFCASRGGGREGDQNGGLFVMYGQTEAGPRIAVLPPEEFPRRPGSAGRAIDGCRLAVVGPDGAPLPPGTAGQVVVHGPGVMMGYAAGRGDLADGDRLGGRLETGDRGHLDADGFLHLAGRAGRIAKPCGHRIDLEELEGLALAGRPAGSGLVAAVDGGDRVVLFLEAAAMEEVRSWPDRLAAEYGHPSSVFAVRPVASLPLTGRGKIDYARLRAWLEEGLEEGLEEMP